MNLWKSIAGMVEVELTSADLAQSLDAVSQEDISVFGVQNLTDLTARFTIYQKTYPALIKLCEKRGEKLEVSSRKGIYWTVLHLLRRPQLYIGMLCLLLSALWIPRHVYFFEVEGNSRIPTNQILEAAAECGIYFGASRRDVRSEMVKNALLSKVPELQWAGVNTRGCVAVICVRERTVTEEENESYGVSSIIAERDGYILSCTATKGSLVCAEGQAVKAGELLISGYTDCGISIQATQAEGEVWAQTIRKLDVITPKKWSYHNQHRGSKYCISLLVGKKRLNLWKDSGIWDDTCGRMYKEFYMTLPGGFQLPVAVCIDRYECCSEIPGFIDVHDTFIRQFSRTYLQQKMIAGEIQDIEETFEESDDFYMLKGSYICKEMIGRVKAEKMGVENG